MFRLLHLHTDIWSHAYGCTILNSLACEEKHNDNSCYGVFCSQTSDSVVIVEVWIGELDKLPDSWLRTFNTLAQGRLDSLTMRWVPFICNCFGGWKGIFGGQIVWVTQRINGKWKGGTLRWFHLDVSSCNFHECSYLQVVLRVAYNWPSGIFFPWFQ